MKVTNTVTIEDAEGGGLKMVRTPAETIDEVDETSGVVDFRCESGVPQGVRSALSFMETPLLSGGVLQGGVDSPFMLGRQESAKSGSMVRIGTFSSSIHQAGTSRFDSSRSRYRGSGVRKQRRRAVFKNGECNVLKSRISHRHLRYLQDLFTTLVDSQWRWTLLVFALSFILSWLVFACVWWLIAFTHGDLEPEHQLDDSDWEPCVVQIRSFTSCFLFSIETQHTIGYGSRSTTEECPEAVFVMCLQSIYGVMVQAFMVGIVFAKMTRPKQRTQTLLFSRNAVICQRDGDLCLMFRVGDMRKSHILGACIRAQLIRSRTTKEGELIPHCQIELDVGTDGGSENLFFIWPMTIVHRIDSSSPFFRYSAADLVERDSRLEIVVILEGTIESTGQTTQARSSYLPSEVLWGHRFESIIEYSKDRQGYEVDYSRFNNTYQVDTPLCSARDLSEFYRIQEDLVHTPQGLMYRYGGGSSISTATVSTPQSPVRLAGGRRHLASNTSSVESGDC